MPKLKNKSVKRNDLLPQITGFMNANKFSGIKLMTPFNSALPTNPIPLLNIDSQNTVVNTHWSGEGLPAHHADDVDHTAYTTSPRKMVKPAKDLESKIYGRYYNYEKVVVKRLINAFALSLEYDYQETMSRACINMQCTEIWNETTKTIHKDILAAKTKIRDSGVKPNFIAIPNDLFEELTQNELILNHLKYSKTEFSLLEDFEQAKILAKYFKIGHLEILDTLKYDLENKKHVPLWDNATVFIGRRGVEPPSILDEEAFGSTIFWNQEASGGDNDDAEIEDMMGFQLDSYRNEDLEADMYRLSTFLEAKILRPNLLVGLKVK